MAKLQRSVIVAALGSLCFIEPAAGTQAEGQVSGEITVMKNGAPRSDRSNVVVYLEGVPATSGAKRKAAIRQKDLQFAPRISVVVKGTVVDFPNDDKVFHNVFSASRASRFDLGLYRSGASKSVEFKRTGVVDVFCNIHPEMSSRVLVVPSTHFATTDATGKFRIDGVPPGTYSAVVWHPNGPEVRTSVTVGAGKAATLKTSIDEGEAPPQQHRRKDGTPYGRYE